MKPRILYVDDEADNLRAFEVCCEDYWEIETLESPNPILNDEFSVDRFDALLIDLVFNFKDGKPPAVTVAPDARKGFWLLEWIKKVAEDAPTVVITALGDPVTRGRIAKDYSNVLFIEKPVNFADPEFRKMIEDHIRDHSR